LKPRLRGWNTSAEIDDLYQRARDYEKDGDTIIKLLELDSNSMVIDMGAGTGTFELHAAKHCRISLRGGRIFHHTELLPEKRRRDGVSNALYCDGGFLTYEHEAEPADVMVLIAVLHHLPDFRKLVALTIWVSIPPLHPCSVSRKFRSCCKPPLFRTKHIYAFQRNKKCVINYTKR